MKSSVDVDITLVTGGAASGKSQMAEALCCAVTGTRLYIATMQPHGTEGDARVKKHRAERAGKGFTTLERYFDLHELCLSRRYGAALLEDLGNLAANHLFDRPGGDPARTIVAGIEHVARQVDRLVVVANEVFHDAQIFDAEMERYLTIMAEIHRRVAKISTCVVESVCGLPQVLRGELRL